ncbi:unnamed protein product [Ixodes pacificus]
MNGSRLLARQHDSAARGSRGPPCQTKPWGEKARRASGRRRSVARDASCSRSIRSGGAEEAAGHLPVAGGREAHLVLRWPLVRGRGGHGSRGIGLLPPLRGPPLPAPNAADAAAHAADAAPLRAGARTWDGRGVRHLPPAGRGARRYLLFATARSLAHRRSSLLRAGMAIEVYLREAPLFGNTALSFGFRSARQRDLAMQ